MSPTPASLAPRALMQYFGDLGDRDQVRSSTGAWDATSGTATSLGGQNCGRSSPN